MPIYMEFEGIKGNVTEEKHKDWIHLHSFQFGVGRGISTAVGNAANREASVPSVSEITVSKELDLASVGLLHASLGGADGKKVTITFTQTDTKGAGRVYLTFKLTNVMVSGYSLSGAGGHENHGRPTETLSLNFTKIYDEYAPHGDENKTGTSTKTEYDLAQGKITV